MELTEFPWQQFINITKRESPKMGCLCTRDVESENEVDLIMKKKYSWDTRKEENFDQSNFVIDALINKEKVQLPGSINGNEFLIQNCRDSTIYVLDHMNTVTIYDCVNCKIILGPVKGSVYIGGCLNCICVSACGQLRIRDSRKILTFIHCETQPVIEASSAIHFGTYQLRYKDIEQHMKCANLNEKRKTWKVVHDFTPLQSETNWKFIDNDNAYDYIKEPLSNDVLEKLQMCEQVWATAECDASRDCSSQDGTSKHDNSDDASGMSAYIF